MTNILGTEIPIPTIDITGIFSSTWYLYWDSSYSWNHF